MNIRAKIYGGAVDEPILRAKKPKGAKADVLNSVSVAREERRRGNARQEDRHRLSDEHARVSHNGGDHDVELVNLSGGGAMVRGGFEPLLWDRVDLHLGDHGTIECAVRWMAGGNIGLEFAHETRLDWSADETATLLREVIARSFPDAGFTSPDDEAKPEAKASADEHRRATRHPLIWSGVLHYDYQSSNARVRNISSTGAMIETRAPMRVGAEAVLELGEEAFLSATVSWAVGDQAGLRFHEPFDMRLLARSKPEVAPTKWMRPAYLENKAATQDSPWDPRWKRLTVNQLSQELEGFLKY